MAPIAAGYKIPRSVLVVIHTPDQQVLLMERAPWPGFWQSVTGSVDREDEPYSDTAVRDVAEETGIDARAHRLTDWGIENQFELMTRWRSRYAPGITHNTEHVFALEVPAPVAVTIAPAEHSRYIWLPREEAAQKCFSWSNRDAILMLPARRAG